jgi:FMN reductase
MPSIELIGAVAISGSPSTTSRSRLLLQHAATRLQSEGVAVQLIDLAALPADDLLARTRSSAISEALARVASSQIVVASTPVYRASYSGLLKVFFDLLPPSALAGKVALGIASGGASGHQLVLDHALRPLFASVGALTTASGIYAVDAQFDANGPTAAILERLDRTLLEAVQLARALSNQLSLSS